MNLAATDVPLTPLRCGAPHPKDRDRRHGILLMKMHAQAYATGRILSRYEEVRKPEPGARFIAVRCPSCKRLTEFRVVR
jgi:hypothetical protein